MEKPKLKYEDGKLIATGSLNVDGDKDGQPSVKLSASLEVDAMEAVSEIVKDKVPAWLKELISKKESEQA